MPKSSIDLFSASHAAIVEVGWPLFSAAPLRL